MPVRIKFSKEVTVKLNLPEEVDPEQSATVKVRQASAGDEAKRQERVNGPQTRIYSPETDDVKVLYEFNPYYIRRLEAYLTLTGCDLEFEDPAKDEFVPVFRFKTLASGAGRLDMQEEEFNERWDQLPTEVTDAINDAVWEVNQHWKPGFRD